MPAANPLLERWRANEPTLGGWMTTADAQIAEYLAGAGFDEICVDQQHGFADRTTIGSVFRAIELYGVAPTTRVPRNDFADIGKALDLGAVAIIVPMVGSPEEAANAAAACHFPPGGSRSVGPLRGSLLRGHHRLEGLDQAACVVMIETSDGVRNADAIAATPGVDAIYIGPGDLALGLGLSAWPDDWSREEASIHAEAIDRIRTACVKHGVAPGIHTGDGRTANRYREQGFLMITVASDLGLIAKGAGDELARARGTADTPAQPTAV
jgi:4-hydroxy-2-oxoheptanedioate aldolase